MPKPEPDYDAEMKLPDGKTCEDCAHWKRCKGFGFTVAGATSCDFHPSRWREAAPAVATVS